MKLAFIQIDFRVDVAMTQKKQSKVPIMYAKHVTASQIHVPDSKLSEKGINVASSYLYQTR